MRFAAVLSNQRGRASKLLVYAIIIGALGYGYYYFQGTPRYALIQFKKAVMFSNGQTAQKYLDINSFISDLPEEITRGADKEALKKRVIYEIDSPTEKSLFSSVKSWSVITVPIDVSEGIASVEQDDGTSIKLEKLNERQWVITSILFKPQETKK